MISISRKDAQLNGLTRFFTGIACRNGHISERRTCDGKCVSCKDAILSKWISENREQSRYLKKKWEDKNKDSIKARAKAARDLRKEEYRIKRKADYPKWKSYFKEYSAKWREKNRERFNQTCRERLRSNLNYRLSSNLRGRIYKAVSGLCKSARTFALIGCDIDFLKRHLESHFEIGMTWENYGKWQIDHTIPCSYFDLSVSENQRICFHWKNLRPMWAGQNTVKYNKLPAGIDRLLDDLRSSIV